MKASTFSTCFRRVSASDLHPHPTNHGQNRHRRAKEAEGDRVRRKQYLGNMGKASVPAPIADTPRIPPILLPPFTMSPSATPLCPHQPPTSRAGLTVGPWGVGSLRSPPPQPPAAATPKPSVLIMQFAVGLRREHPT
jgi:hypothetical protein